MKYSMIKMIVYKSKEIIFCSIVLLLLISFQAVNAQSFLEKRKRPLPFKSNEVVLDDSWVKNREALNTSTILQLDADRLLHNFRINAAIESSAKPLEGWESPKIGIRGHFVGHYLSACASLIGKTKDTLLQRRINYMVDVLWDCQQKLGGRYLSAFPENEFTTLETKFKGVWAPYYTYHKLMQGLLDVYIYTDNKKAYEMVLKMADYVRERMDKLTPEVIEQLLYTPQANPANEPGGMNEVLQNLYTISKDSLHLKLACIFDRKWFSQPLYEGKDILSGLHSNTHIPIVLGYMKRYENTGEVYYRDVAARFWNILLKHHCYANGSSSGPRPIATTATSLTSEHWGVADRLSSTLTDKISESCVSHNTQKITTTLFQWTGSPEYPDVYMNTFYNSVLALQNRENGTNVYSLPLGSPQKKIFAKPNDFFCCNGTTIEAFANLNSNIYFHNDNNLWVNLYTPSFVEWKAKGIKIKQSGNFPDQSTVQFIVSASKSTNFTLNLFIPSWANAQTKVLINGVAVQNKIKPLSYVAINRVWKDGDRVELSFNYNYHIKTMPDNETVVALFYGPVLLAIQTDEELILKGNKSNILKSISRQSDTMNFTLRNNGKEYKLVPFYEITNTSYGVYATIRNDY